MIMAAVAFIPKVKGIRRAIVAEAPRPGRTPTRVPKKQPTTAIQRLYGVKKIAKPCIKLCRTSMDCSSC